MNKKKKRVKAVPFYRKGWFTLAGVATLLMVLAVAFYFLFLKVPDVEKIPEAVRASVMGKWGQ